MSQFFVYADFNCPFCYALEERLQEYKGNYEIEWRPIQHVPNQIGLCNVEDMALLASEVFTVRHRAPEVAIAMPRLRPNSGPATKILTALQNRDQDLAHQFRARIFRALWVEDLDISESEVISNILHDLGVHEPVVTDEEPARLVRWQQEWETADHDRRIPVMTASDGRMLLGLSAPRDIQCFLEGRPSRGEPSGVCEFVPRPVVLVIGQPRNIWPLISSLQPSTDVLVAADAPWAIKLMGDTLAPDLLVVPTDRETDALEICRQLQQHPHAADTPIIIVDEAPSSDRQLQLLEAGVSDYLEVHSDPRLFKARARVHLANKTRRAQLQETVRLDPLTRIPNRRELERVLEVAWRRGIHSRLPLSVAILDVDHFKLFNDTYGHPAGDECLVRVTSALSKALRRGSDMVARYGGEEFALVLPDCTEVGAREIAEICRRAVEELKIPHSASPVTSVVTVSVGLTTAVPSLERNLRSLIDTADKALYQAKSAGRNRVEAREGE